MNPTLPDSLVAACLKDVEHRVFIEALHSHDTVIRYVEDWRGQGHLTEGWTAEDMTAAVWDLHNEQYRADN